MTTTLRIGLLGDRVPDYAKHDALDPGVATAARATGLDVETTWIPSSRLADDLDGEISAYDAFIAIPQSRDYCEDPEALRAALGTVRRGGTCCLAVCGGAQYALSAFAREMSGPAPGEAILMRASCEASTGANGYAVLGERVVELAEDARLSAYFGGPVTRERFECSYVLAEGARALLARSGVEIAGTEPDLGPVLFEWPNHPFYVASLFLPHLSDTQPHP